MCKMSGSLSIILYAAAISFLLVLAVFGNSLVIVCVAKYPKLRTVTNVLICNLAVSDVLLAGFVLPQKLHDMFHEEDFYEGRYHTFCLFDWSSDFTVKLGHPKTLHRSKWAASFQKQQSDCAPSEDSDQPGNPLCAQ